MTGVAVWRTAGYYSVFACWSCVS